MKAAPTIFIQVGTTCPYCGAANVSKTGVKDQDWHHFFVTCGCHMTHACEMRVVPEVRVFKLEKVEAVEVQP